MAKIFSASIYPSMVWDAEAFLLTSAMSPKVMSDIIIARLLYKDSLYHVI